MSPESLYLQSGLISFHTWLHFRPMTGSTGDGLLVSYWRNQPEARAAFFSETVVTPDSHAAWIAAKSHYQQVWMAIDNDTAIGTAALYIDPVARTAEAGPLLVAPECRGNGYAREIDYMMLAMAFEFFQLNSVWGEAFVSNAAILHLHKSVGFRMTTTREHPRGLVQRIEYDRPTWAKRRANFIVMGAELGDWTP